MIAADEMWSEGIAPHGLPGTEPSLGGGRFRMSQTTARATRSTSPPIRPSCSDAAHGGASGHSQ